MMDHTVAADDARRVAQHEATTFAVERDVNEEVAEHGERGDAAEAGKIETLASGMRSDAIEDAAGQGRKKAV